jgi:hypothetical protein
MLCDACRQAIERRPVWTADPRVDARAWVVQGRHLGPCQWRVFEALYLAGEKGLTVEQLRWHVYGPLAAEREAGTIRNHIAHLRRRALVGTDFRLVAPGRHGRQAPGLYWLEDMRCVA